MTDLEAKGSVESSFSSDAEPRRSEVHHTWTYLSNHVHVLLCLYRDPTVRLRDVAQFVGITERGVTRIVSELEEEGVVSKQRQGRRNTYSIYRDAKLRHGLESHLTIGQLLDLLNQ